MSTGAWVVCCFLFFASGAAFVGAALMWWPERHHPVVVDLNHGLRPQSTPDLYVCILSDWGPEYTGFDDTLHRWRWTLAYFDTGAIMMLGNSPNREDAINDAAQWLAGWDVVAEMKVDEPHKVEHP